METFSIFHFWMIHFLDCKQYVGAGMNSLMSISDRLGPSIFCRKMEKVRPMREEKNGMERLFISRHSRHFDSDAVIYKSTFQYLYLDLACKQLCFPPGKRYK